MYSSSNNKWEIRAIYRSDIDIDVSITAATVAVSKILGKERRSKKRRITRDVLDLCDERRDLKRQYEAERIKEYRETNCCSGGFRRQ